MSILILVLFLTFAYKVQSQQVVDRFADWMTKHQIQSKDESHLAHIFDNWVENDKYIKEVNSKNLSYTLGHNAYSGMNIERVR